MIDAVDNFRNESFEEYRKCNENILVVRVCVVVRAYGKESLTVQKNKRIITYEKFIFNLTIVLKANV